MVYSIHQRIDRTYFTNKRQVISLRPASRKGQYGGRGCGTGSIGEGLEEKS